MGSADPLHRVHGRRLATVSGPVRKPPRRSSGALQRAGEERVQEPSAGKGLREGGVCSWLPEVGTMQDARRQQNSIGRMWCGWASRGRNPAVAWLANPLSVRGCVLPEQAPFLIYRKAACTYTCGRILLTLPVLLNKNLQARGVGTWHFPSRFDHRTNLSQTGLRLG